eukprot:TRINITY_DN1917_c0_g1_i4.p1 TRINITY_DN1917_c0_g1~~TRINITY_DN1917_c0_g1_i4.p1  ORF type:complete len:1150 (+),score=351.82 TRINITY_DN1917_c0_g1_i4:48-3497(+)
MRVKSPHAVSPRFPVQRSSVFGAVRSIAPFRLTGGSKDYIVVGSDSGRIVILEYNPAKNTFDKVHQETFGKSGCRRIVPGQYLAIDPKGRAVMIAAVEKQKLVYILNRDSAARLTISSPLEAHKARSIIYSIIGVDVGFENPVFAALEQEYEADEEESLKSLVFYELDLGLNHVVRKHSDTVDPTSNMLIPVPGGSDGPGGVLVCSENYITFKNQGHPDIRAPIPRRTDSEPRGLLIVSFASHKQRDSFFFLVQSEYGDIYKVTLAYDEDTVTEVNIRYFDTVPVAVSLCVMKTGFLFVASEFGNHALYQFQSLSDDNAMQVVKSENPNDPFTYFAPHALKNLLLIDDVESLGPILDFKVADIAREETPQIYALTGRGPRSSLRVLRHGLAVGEMAVSPLPGNPSAVWTVRRSIKDEVDKYIVISFVNATLVLAIGDTVEEDKESGYLATAPTIHTANIGDDGIIQIHPNGIRHIRGDKRIHEWKTPSKKTIVKGTSNNRQVVIALNGGDILYFELDSMGQLIDVDKKFTGREIYCLDIAPIPEGRQRTRFLGVGDSENTVRIFSLDPEDCLQSLSVQALPTAPESLSIVEMRHIGDVAGSLFLNIGLNNGVLLRSALDSITGELTDTRTRYLGSRPVKLYKVILRGGNATLALSSRSWLCYNYHGRSLQTPLSYTPLEAASSFASDQCPEGIVSIAGNTLRILTVERLGEMFNQTEVPLLHTPRKFVVHPATSQLVVIETDQNATSIKDSKLNVEASDDMDMDTGENQAPAKSKFDLTPQERVIGLRRPGVGSWASCVRLLDTVQNKTLDLIELPENEGAFSICTCVFHDRQGEVFIIVGTAKDLRLYPQRTCSGGFINVFRLLDNGQLQFLHKSATDNVPLALCPFQGRLLVGCGKALRIYDMGKKKMLRKAENKNFPNLITNITTQGDRIYVSDIQESIHFVKFKKSENAFYTFADETVSRFLTSSIMLDYDTFCGADKFGNIFISRLPSQVSDEVEADPTGSKFKMDQGALNGAPHKLEEVAGVHIGDTITNVTKASLVLGGAEALIFSTMAGTIGALLPFTSREDIDFFSHLEMHLRQENPPLCGRDHLSYRSAFFPVKNVVDGDLCEQFAALEPEKQKQIADELDRSPMEVLKKLEDIRNRLL